MENQSKARLSELADQAIILDLQEIDMWKRSTHRNTAFAKQNVKLAEMSLKNIVEQQKRLK